MSNLEEGIAVGMRDDADVGRMIETKVPYMTAAPSSRSRTPLLCGSVVGPEQKQTIHDPAEIQRLADAHPTRGGLGHLGAASQAAITRRRSVIAPCAAFEDQRPICHRRLKTHC